jgi:hypothetical protein
MLEWACVYTCPLQHDCIAVLDCFFIYVFWDILALYSNHVLSTEFSVWITKKHSCTRSIFRFSLCLGRDRFKFSLIDRLRGLGFTLKTQTQVTEYEAQSKHKILICFGENRVSKKFNFFWLKFNIFCIFWIVLMCWC